MKIYWLLIFILFTLGACANKGTTPAKVKLNLAGIVNLNNGIGSGGAILYGQSVEGDSFGKVINKDSDNLELPNGNWTLYAFMWESPDLTATPVDQQTIIATPNSGILTGSTNSSIVTAAISASPMNGNIFCGSDTKKLDGTSASITLNLTNSNCNKASLGKIYNDISAIGGTSSTKVRFTNVFIEDCDVVTSKTGFTCGAGNKGNALSYRVVFNNFSNKGNVQVGTGQLLSACQSVNRDVAGSLNSGLPVNFPQGDASTFFPVSVEMFFGSNNCDSSDPKGSYTAVLNKGFANENFSADHLVQSGDFCQFSSVDFAGSDLNEIRNKCENVYGAYGPTINGTNAQCSLTSIPKTITLFAPTTSCSSHITSDSSSPKFLKHLISIPFNAICDRYLNLSSKLGNHPFSAGDGSVDRPYKICTEWQLNQIGDAAAPESYKSYNYKLLNDLDMNKTDGMIGPYTKPSCVGTSGSILDEHTNLNSLDKLANSDCSILLDTNGFKGVFDGNNKNINNARINSKTDSIKNVGFVRSLKESGVIKNINFKNLEISGSQNVGGVAGFTIGTSTIANIHMSKASIDLNDSSSNNQLSQSGSQNYINSVPQSIGGIVGGAGNGTILQDIIVEDSHIRGKDYTGGLVGSSNAMIERSSFRGDIQTQGQNSTSSHTGGIAGVLNLGGSIKSSFSEGSISANGYAGGIVGINSSGVISKAYSTMAFFSDQKNSYNYNNGNTSITNYYGGIVANSYGGSIDDVYFYGYFDPYLYTNNNQALVKGVVTSYQSTTFSHCYAANQAVATGTEGCQMIFPGYMRDANRSFTPGSFGQIAGSLPRLSWEKRLCSDPENLKSLGLQSSLRGKDAKNPMIVCHKEQLLEMKNFSSGNYFKLGEDINLSELTTSENLGNFSGNLSGEKRNLYGLSVTNNTSQEYFGLFSVIQKDAQVSNLTIMGATLTSESSTLSAGILAGTNKGIVSKISIQGSTLSALNSVGGLVGANEGQISEVRVSNLQLNAVSNAGGIVGDTTSTSKISKVDVNASISTAASGSSNSKFGGIAGTNMGSIDQARFGGTINYSSSSSDMAMVGLISGLNVGESAIITNALVDNYSSLYTDNSNYVGGFIGKNNFGKISKSLSLGKVIFKAYDSNGLPFTTVASTFDPMIGSNNAGDSYVQGNFYLQNNAGIYLGHSRTFSAATSNSNSNSIFIVPLVYDQYNFNLSSGSSADLFTANDNNYNRSITSLIPMLVSGANQFSYSSDDYANPIVASTDVDIYKSVPNSYSGQKRKTSDFSDIGTFSGLNIGTFKNQNDVAKLIGFYLAIMNDRPVPTTAPIWVLEDGYPSLLQLNVK